MVDSLVLTAVEKLAVVLTEEIDLFASVTDELKKLKETFESIQAVLSDAGNRQIREKSEQLWLSRLRDVAVEIGKLLDKGLSSARREDKDGCKVCDCLSFLIDYGDSVFSRYKVARQIKDIRERLDRIVEEKKRYFFITSGESSGGGEKMGGSSSRPVTTSLFEESDMNIRMEEDKEAVISRLLSGNSNGKDGHINVIAIVGGENSGKTTLARQIYHDGKVGEYFKEDRYWVCVTDVFDVVRLTKAMIEQATGESTSLSELNSLQNKLLGALKGKRFLLVLDDVWNKGDRRWDMLRVSLKSGEEGSMILVTTRSEEVANTMNATYIHELKKLKGLT